jgi:dTMP kinase
LPGRLVVIDGVDGCGKTTQVARLVARLAANGIDAFATFEPGATALGRRIRALVLHGSDPVEPMTEALLMAADRAQHVRETVRPALARGVWVVSDRYVASSLAYQGIARGLGVDVVERINAPALDGVVPDVVVVLDVAPEVLAARRASRSVDRIEGAGAAFLAAVLDGFRSLAAERDWVVVDGGADPDTVESVVWAAVAEEIGIEGDAR